MIAIEPHSEGAILPVRAQPGARRNSLGGEQDGQLKVAVTQMAEKGKANRAIVEVLARELSLRKSQVELLSGETAARKRYLIRGLTPAQLSQRISSAAKGLAAVFLALIATFGMIAVAAAPPDRNDEFLRVRALSPNDRGDRIPDFSNCGYAGGGVELPRVAVRQMVHPVAGDAGPAIQQAIDKVSSLPRADDGFRGAVVLTKGTYPVGGSIHIRASGVVLRGEGDADGGTTLVATGAGKRALIEIGGNESWREVPGSQREVADAYVPVGARSLQLKSASGLKVGSRVIVHRPSTAEWIHALGMDRIPMRADRNIKQWQPGSKDLDFDRVVTAVDSQRITLDAPLVCALDQRYGGGAVFEYDFPGRIDHVGIENLAGVSEFQGPTDENHSWVFIEMRGLENGWVRHVTARHFASSAVRIGRGAKWITVEDCACRDPISEIIGGRRYSFDLEGGELTLWQRCHARDGRHDFVTGATVCGPSVFLDCTAEKVHADAGPHHRWAVGILYDNVRTDGALNVRNRGNLGTGHGWAGANQVFWNCTANEMTCERPPTADNWAIGCIAKTRHGDGAWESFGQPVEPASLYRWQLANRLGR
jgi:uncharacterized protein YggU (UPF0235/DUF167 family)